MEYNSSRPDLIIREYGRNVQQMVDFAMGTEDREERNKIAKAIISVMGQLFPHLRDIEDFNHKLWDHLYIMSDFKMDVDSPYPMPDREVLDSKPDRLNYPGEKIRYGHYGKSVQHLIEKAIEYPEGEEKDTLVLIIANLMKRHYVTWNRNTVEDSVIIKQLGELSKNQLSLKEGQVLATITDIPQRPVRKKSNHGARKKMKKR